MLQEFRVELSDMDVTPTQAGVLLYVQRYPGTYRQRVADAFELDASWTGTVVRALQHKGWLRKKRARQDDRYALLTVTRKGSDLVGKILTLEK